MNNMVSSVLVLFVVFAVTTALPQSPGKGNKTERLCKLAKDPSVEYRCMTDLILVGFKLCSDQEPSGTVVQANCKPGYYSPSPLPNMRCIDGSWDYVSKCIPECGRGDPRASFASIYRKTTNPFEQICGGSLISNRVVISAAHCFTTNDGNIMMVINSETDYAVAFRKSVRPWDSPKDVDVQKSDISKIVIPSRYQGHAANFQEDLSLLILKEVVLFNIHVLPVCLSFDNVFERHQLQDGNIGKIASWDGLGQNKPLIVKDVPISSIEVCLAETLPAFRPYITGDKFCSRKDATVCRGDSGHGLVLPSMERGVERNYLRGVLSVGQPGDSDCNPGLAVFTQVSRFEHLIRDYLV